MPQQSKQYCLVLILLVLNCASVHGQTSETQPTRRIKRVAKPVFKDDQGEGTFFKDVFEEALVGKRPPVPSASSLAANVAGRVDDSAGKTWSRLISAATLEDEVKALQQSLGRDLTTASRFRSCLLYTSPSPRDLSTSRMPSSA